MKRLILATTVLCVSLSSFASGVSIKGGGTGVDMGTHVALLDLLEAGLDQTPYFGSAACDGQIFKSLEALSPSDSNTHQLVCRKLYDVAALDPVLATTFLKTIANLSWVPTDADLVETDADPIIRVKTVQLAVRNGNRVLVQRGLYNRLPPTHQAALVIHEVAAALVSPAISSPLPVRILVGNVFEKNYYSRSTEQILNDLRYFPSRRAMRGRFQGWTHLELPQDSIETNFTLDNGVGTNFFPSVSMLWIDTKTDERNIEGLYVTPESASRVHSILSSCNQPAKNSKRLFRLSVEFLNPAIFARIKLENGTQTDRYDFENDYNTMSIVQFTPNEPTCSSETKAALKEISSWLAGFSRVPLR